MWGWKVAQGETHILFNHEKSCIEVREYVHEIVDKMMSKRPFEKITIEWQGVVIK
jgi:hypothetical protein